MAFDQATRNRLQRFVTDARRVLEEEFTRQLQSDYGLDPVSGTASALESLRHINDQQRETARILRDTLAHYCASSETDTAAGLDRIVREQAFTILNRLAALRMAEARGLLIESVGNGYQAKGFQLYARLAGTGLGETGDAYRVYLKSVFDEFALDLPGLFDRYSPQGRLFPREPALLQVLALINHGEIEPLWAEDETIGWIYQYFNSKEERKAMREASQAPRNSRELAVRNQFFTPRYVVEFLVDNTLGRLWFNWTGGRTSLRDRCQYLLVKPDEKPEAAERLRDPRTIKLLDPACGSMHFGLYAFDLFQEIYREAWEWEQTYGSDALDRETGGSADLKPLAKTYADQDAFLRDVPRLIIEHNVYGVDIDSRAAQIASLALWLRAQRAWHEAGVRAKDRPQVGQGHVVAAVAPPAELDLRKQFMEELDPLDAELFERTLFLLKGLPELGVLLQVEKQLPALVREVFGEHGPMFAKEDMAQWKKAEARLREALMDYARAARATYRGRLFAEDALQGLRMIDHCREAFDVVVMNPPFGNNSRATKSYIDVTYPRSKNDVLSVFVDRGIDLLRKEGLLGAITSRACFFAVSFAEWRRNLLTDKAPLAALLDLGHGVMDDAMVEASAYCIHKQGNNEEFPVLRVIKEREKEKRIEQLIQLYRSGIPDGKVFISKRRDFEKLPSAPLAYWADPSALIKMAQFPTFEPSTADVRKGLRTGDNFRFVRAIWEVDPGDLTTHLRSSSTLEEKKLAIWVPLVLSGSSQPWFSPQTVVIKWKRNGAELREFVTKYGSPSRLIQAEDFYFRPGMSWTRRARRFVPYAVPSGCIPTGSRPMAFPAPGKEMLSLAVSGSRIASAFMRFYGEKFEFPNFLEGKVKLLPIPPVTSEDMSALSKMISESYLRRRKAYEGHEPFHEFCVPFGLNSDRDDGAITNNAQSILGAEMESLVEHSYGFCDSEVVSMCADLDEVLKVENATEEVGIDDVDISEDAEVDESILDYSTEAEFASYISYCVGVAFGRWDLRIALGSRRIVSARDPFAAMPSTPPGFYTDSFAKAALNNDSKPLEQPEIQLYPVELPKGAILVDDPANPHDITARVQLILQIISRGRDRQDIEDSANAILGVDGIREYFQKSSKFFARHLATYTKSRRKAPIYWPLSTASGSYTLWIYYPKLTSQTLYTGINDFLEPKLNQVSRDAAFLRDKGTARSRDDENTFEALQAFELELIELRDTLMQIAPTYRPSHDDGVQITAAPLWRLFRHKPWQKILKDTWAKLEKGDYDWAHLAFAYWPDRVREKCKTDKSLAIAHDLEALYVEPQGKPTKKRARKEAGDDE